MRWNLTRVGVVVLAIALLGGGLVVATDDADSHDRSTIDPPNLAENASIAQFGNTTAFRRYVRRGSPDTAGYYGDLVRGGVGGEPTREREAGQPTVTVTEDAQAEPGQQGTDRSASGSERHSRTNVQETGVDEPAILKTTGDTLYYSRTGSRVVRETAVDAEDSGTDPGRTAVFNTTDPATPERIADIDASGRLLRSADRLIVLEDDRLVGYDVTDPDSPTRKWAHPIEGSIVTARLLDGRVYLVTQDPVPREGPCRIEPLGGDAPVACGDVYRPSARIDADATYSAFAIAPEDGEIRDSVSFVGTRDRTAVYVSRDAMYVTYTRGPDSGRVILDALLAAETPPWVDQRLRIIRGYNLSAEATAIEARATIEKWLDTLPVEERQRLVRELRDDVRSYVREHRRELVRTGIVRVDVGDGLDVASVGTVPGEPLNQFSMDQHNGTLRIATTIPRQFGLASANDLYTLNATSLERIGSVQGMGLDERVYAVRYVGETAYVVTYRQVDPFHVVDLSNPADPAEVGTLELPGYSSYLHPIDDEHVLGIGREDGRVKAVLFNVSDPSNPRIDDTYYPAARWSAISESHHAFLLDRRHGVFFLPGEDGGYVVNYTDGDLREVAAIEMRGGAQRAAYIDNYLYFVGPEQLVVVDERDWSRVATRELRDRAGD